MLSSLPSWTPASKDGFASPSPAFGLQDSQPNFALPPPSLTVDHGHRSQFPYPPQSLSNANQFHATVSTANTFVPRHQQQQPNFQQDFQRHNSQATPSHPSVGDTMGEARSNLHAGGTPMLRGSAPVPPFNNASFPGLMGPNSRPYGSYPVTGRPFPPETHGQQRDSRQPEYPIGFPGSESAEGMVLQRQNGQLQHQLQQRLHHERLFQERMEQERILKERQQMLANQEIPGHGPSNTPLQEPTNSFGWVSFVKIKSVWESAFISRVGKDKTVLSSFIKFYQNILLLND